jgi:hypothetical protein
MKTITLYSTKYNGAPHWRWQAQLLAEGPDGWVCYTPPGTTITTWAGEWRTDGHSVYHFWPGRWYNVVRVYRPGDTGPFFCCNVITPPVRDGEGLRWRDLDLDIIAWPDGSAQVLDEDEFAANAEKYAYPPGVRAQAGAAVGTLLDLLHRREPPFEFGLPLEALLARWGLDTDFVHGYTDDNLPLSQVWERGWG